MDNAPESSPKDVAPENVNAAQDEDAATQAQAVAEAARRKTPVDGLAESTKKSGDGLSDGVQDLVDHMIDMVASGRIDNDAFRGEPNHDDNVDKFGPGSKIDDLRGDGT